MSRLLRHMADFLRKEDGSSTIESLLWIPFLFSIALMSLDLSLVYTKQSMVMRIVQDGNRAFAISRDQGTTTNTVLASQTQTRVQAAVRKISPRAQVVSRWDSTTKTITTSVRMPATDLSPIGIISGWGQQYVGFQAQHTKEF